jgi:hypothetical protein
MLVGKLYLEDETEKNKNALAILLYSFTMLV